MRLSNSETQALADQSHPTGTRDKMEVEEAATTTLEATGTGTGTRTAGCGSFCLSLSHRHAYPRLGLALMTEQDREKQPRTAEKGENGMGSSQVGGTVRRRVSRKKCQIMYNSRGTESARRGRDRRRKRHRVGWRHSLVAYCTFVYAGHDQEGNSLAASD